MNIRDLLFCTYTKGELRYIIYCFIVLTENGEDVAQKRFFAENPDFNAKIFVVKS